MLVVSWRLRSGGTPPVRIRTDGRTEAAATGGVMTAVLRAPEDFRPADQLLKNLDAFRNVDLLVYAAPGTELRPPLPELERTDWDVAAYVRRHGEPSFQPGPFDGVGEIYAGLLAFRRSPAAHEVLERWAERSLGMPGREALALAIALTEVREARFLRLPPEYAWEEGAMRAFHRDAVPRIVRGTGPTAPEQRSAPARPPAPQPSADATRPPELLWNGHLYDLSGFAKANREILLRIANSVRVGFDPEQPAPGELPDDLRVRLDAHWSVPVGPRAPFLRFFGPDWTPPAGRSRTVVWTMMESTGHVHADMVRHVNRYDELWVPTEWGRQLFIDSGVRCASRVMPLGVNPAVYRPQPGAVLPECLRISGPRAGRRGRPDGFVFLTVGLHSFRKGFDFLVEVFDAAFAVRRDVHLVVATTHSLGNWNDDVARLAAGRRAPIWLLPGRFDEHGMARIYAAADAYVSASRGEGVNLPALEAAACGLPVVVPDNTSHPEVVGGRGWLFPVDSAAPWSGAEAVSPWYRDVPFSVFGPRARTGLAETLRAVVGSPSEVARRTAAFAEWIHARSTWDHAAHRVVERLLEIQPEPEKKKRRRKS